MNGSQKQPMSDYVESVDTLLAAHVSGTLALPVDVLVRAHLELSDDGKRFVGDLEALAGAELEELDPVPVTVRDQMLRSIFAVEQETARHDTQPGGGDVIPAALRGFLDCALGDVPWRTVIPGIKEWRIGTFEGVKASLYKIGAGTSVPSHTHRGIEATLVLDGGFSDSRGHYLRGDIALADGTVDHRPVADDDGDCICFAVTEAPLRFTGPVGRFLSPFVR